jgi:hypothetical protein
MLAGASDFVAFLLWVVNPEPLISPRGIAYDYFIVDNIVFVFNAGFEFEFKIAIVFFQYYGF